MIPIVDRVLRNGGKQGIQAVVVYPMNALCNSQYGELEKFLRVGFGLGKKPMRLAKTERDPVSTSGASIFSMSQNRAILPDKSIRFSPLAAARPLTIRSWPEALNAKGSRHAGRMPIGRHACSRCRPRKYSAW